MPTYARCLGLFSATMAVIGGIIGAGIFRTPAAVAGRAGSPGETVAVWIAGGVIALVGAFCFAELGQRCPKAGGGYVYLRDAWGGLPAFLYGWALLLVIATGATAAVAVTFAGYALDLAGLPDRFTVPLAVAAIGLLTGVNCVGVRPGAITQNVFTVLKLGALAALIVVGLAAPLPPAAPVVPAPTHLPVAHGGLPAFAAVLVPVVFTYGGWQQTNFIAEEIVEPARNLPRALVLGVSAVTVVYLLANLAYLRVLGLPALAASTAPATDAMRLLLGRRGATLVAGGIVASTFGYLGLVILVTPRVFQTMAADGVFFPRLARLHPVYRTPVAALLLQGAWAIVLTLSGTFNQLVDYVTFGDWIFFALTAAALFVYRRRDQATGSAPVTGFRAPLYPWTPVLFVAAALLVVVGSVAANPGNAMVGSGLLALGIPAYLYWRRRTRSG